MYEIETENFYRDMWEQRDLYDLSGYPKSSPFFCATNNKVVGKMKDETSGDPIIEFVGLRPKMYSFLTLKSTGQNEDIKDKHRAKGIDRVASAQLQHEDFKKQLAEPVENYLINRRIGAKLHQIHSIEVHIVMLGAFSL